MARRLNTRRVQRIVTATFGPPRRSRARVSGDVGGAIVLAVIFLCVALLLVAMCSSRDGSRYTPAPAASLSYVSHSYDESHPSWHPAVSVVAPSREASSGGAVHVRGYTRKDGTYVRPHTRNR